MSPAPSARNGHVLEDGRPSALETAGPRVPVAANMLSGREREVAYLQRCLAQPAVRLVTILGAPGAGKTRVCIEVATRVDALSDTLVYFIPLAPIRTPELVLPSICMALGIPERHGVSSVNALQATLPAGARSWCSTTWSIWSGPGRNSRRLLPCVRMRRSWRPAGRR